MPGKFYFCKLAPDLQKTQDIKMVCLQYTVVFQGKPLCFQIPLSFKTDTYTKIV